MLAQQSRFLEPVRTMFQHNLLIGRSAWNNTPYRYIAPARGYPFQWLWDTAFHAIVLTHLDTTWAKDEIRNFFLAQRKSGFLPHVVFWGGSVPLWGRLLSRKSLSTRMTSITQPPMLAIAVERIAMVDPDIAFLEEMVPKLIRYHKWLLRRRNPYGTGLVSIISADESGMDELPVFQYAAGLKGNSALLFHFFNRKTDVLNKWNRYDLASIYRQDYFSVSELLFNSIFIEANQALSRLCLRLGRADDAAFFRSAAEQALASMIRTCWDEPEAIFYSTYSSSQTKIPIKTVASLLPLFINELPKDYVDKLVHLHLLNTKEFWLPFPVPSVSEDEIYFHPRTLPVYWIKALWRGPTWFNTNWLIVKGLQKHGYDDVAQTIVDKMTFMVEREGFREYYDPTTGEGHGKKDFGWSTLLVDLLPA